MQPPSPTPSKNWWKDKATRRGLIVATLWEAPISTPIITEWKTIPDSSTLKKTKTKKQKTKNKKQKTKQKNNNNKKNKKQKTKNDQSKKSYEILWIEFGFEDLK